MTVSRKRILFQITLILVCSLSIELVLRWSGCQPGDLRPNWLQFTPVDSLMVDDLFFTTREGILVANRTRWAKTGLYINTNGFRNKEFSEIDSTKKKILLIGDSYVWGSSARPIEQCFADLLRKETDYEIINLGIQAVDPPQYLQLTQKFLPLLNPDFLLVFFYMGNDLMKQDRTSPMGKPFVYVTNAGVIPSYDGSVYFDSAEKSYQYFVNEKYFLKKPANALEKIISKSCILSKLYSIRFRLEEKWAYENVVKDASISKNYLKSIQQTAVENKVPVKFVLIPELKEAEMDSQKYADRYASLLSDPSLKNEWIPLHPKKSLFRDYPDGHLNNEGHRFYADYLKSYLHDFFTKP